MTVPDDRIDALLNEQRSLLDDNLKQLTAAAAAGRGAMTLAEAPRIHKQSIILRRLYYAFARQENLQELDLELIRHFKNDRTLLVKFATDHISRNWYNSAEWLLSHSEPDAQQRRQILTLLGQSLAVDQSGQALTPKEMWQRLLPVWMSGDNEEARRILRRVDRSKGITNERLGYVTYVMVNGVMVPRQPRLTADVSAWTRLAIQLGDEGLALTFARSQLQHKSRYGARNVKQMFESYRNVLPADSFRSLVRFAANLYRNDDKRVVEYLWLVSNLGAEIGGELPTDEELLKLVEDGNLRLNYQFPFQQAMETFPESIRDKALEI